MQSYAAIASAALNSGGSFALTAQGFLDFFAAHGLQDLPTPQGAQLFLAAHGMQGEQGLFTARGFSRRDFATKRGITHSVAARAEAQGLQVFLAAHGFPPFFAAQGLGWQAFVAMRRPCSDCPASPTLEDGKPAAIMTASAVVEIIRIFICRMSH